MEGECIYDRLLHVWTLMGMLRQRGVTGAKALRRGLVQFRAPGEGLSLGG